jgi:apolipoprotein D and lipocalin family protein
MTEQGVVYAATTSTDTKHRLIRTQSIQQKGAFMRYLLSAISILIVTACTGVPKGVTPVSPFDIKSYLGEWHEIARLDHSFERGLTEVTAQYSRREDGGINVINRGYNAKDGVWEQAEGKAYFVDDSNTGRLKVSFFGPFYGGYNIAQLEPDYSMALVIGPSLEYAWLLSRSPAPATELCQRYFDSAQSLGITSDQWIHIRSCTSH